MHLPVAQPPSLCTYLVTLRVRSLSRQDVVEAGYGVLYRLAFWSSEVYSSRFGQPAALAANFPAVRYVIPQAGSLKLTAAEDTRSYSLLVS